MSPVIVIAYISNYVSYMAFSLIRHICYIQNMISTRPIHVMWGKCNIWNLIFDALYLLITGNRYFQNMKCHYIYLWFSCYKRKLQHFRWTFWWSPFACDWKQLHTKYQFSSDLFLLWEVTATSEFFFDGPYLLIMGNRYFQSINFLYIHHGFSYYERKIQHFKFEFWWSFCPYDR